MPTTTRFTHLILALSTAALLQACGTAPPPDAYLIPEEPGLYAVRYRTPERIDGDPEFEAETWERRSTLPPVAEFVVFDEGLDMTHGAIDTIHLRRVAWVRSRYTTSGAVAPISGSQWGVPDLEHYEVPVTLRTVAGRTDVIRVTPESNLEPGLYSLEYGDTVARIGVDWPNVDPDVYAGANCVDIHETADGATFADCSTPELVTATMEPEFKITLADPQSETVDGEDVLVIVGTLTNAAEAEQPPPLLTAQLKDANGDVLIEWDFQPSSDALAAGETIDFRTRVVNPPDETASVFVDLSDLVHAG